MKTLTATEQATLKSAQHILASEKARKLSTKGEMVEILDVHLRDLRQIRYPGTGRLTVEITILRNQLSTEPSTV